MEITKSSRAARIALFSLSALVLGFAGPAVAIFNRPIFDPAPKGEGSFQEADAITLKFRNFYRTKDASLLPQGYVRMEGIVEDDLDGTWLVYYATASHGWVRGGTIILLDSSGRIDTYFGHHCSSGDGGSLVVTGLNGPFYDGRIDGVRADIAKAFKLQNTEQVVGGNGG